MPPLDIRPMRRADLDTALGWAAAEGWNPGLADADCFWAADPTGYLMGWLGDAPVGCISAVSYGPSFGFIGLYIVAPGERGKGYGLQLWQQAMDMLGDRTIGLDGVVAQQANYARSGFSLAHRNIRYGGVVSSVSALADPSVVRVTGELFEAVAAFDRTCFPAPREEFLRCWLGGPRTALAFVEDCAVCGYGVVRAAKTGFKVGPLFADAPGVAEALFLALAASCGGAQIFIDVPEPNASARALAERVGLAPVFETARMYRGRAPDMALNRVFGSTTLEMG